MTKMMSGYTTIWAVDKTGTYNPLAPKASALIADIASNKAINLSCAIGAGYTLNPTDSDTDDSKSICDRTNSQTLGASNYEGLLQFFRELDPVTNTDSIYQAAWAKFRFKGWEGTLVQRFGYDQLVAPAVNQLVNNFTFLSDNPRDIVEDGNGPIRFEVPFLKQGFVDTYEPLAAG